MCIRDSSLQGETGSTETMTLTNSTPLIERAQNEDVTDDDIDPAAPPKRRTFTPEQKLAILAAYDAATGPGAKGAYLRQEGIYSSHITDGVAPWTMAPTCARSPPCTACSGATGNRRNVGVSGPTRPRRSPSSWPRSRTRFGRGTSRNCVAQTEVSTTTSTSSSTSSAATPSAGCWPPPSQPSWPPTSSTMPSSPRGWTGTNSPSTPTGGHPCAPSRCPS